MVALEPGMIDVGKYMHYLVHPFSATVMLPYVNTIMVAPQRIHFINGSFFSHRSLGHHWVGGVVGCTPPDEMGQIWAELS